MTDEKNAAEPSGASGGSLAWIPVEQSRPSYNDAAWVFDGTDVFMAEYWDGSGFMSYGASCDREGLNSGRIHGVTHWMEIAEPLPPATSN